MGPGLKRLSLFGSLAPGLPKLIDPTTAAETLGIPFFELVDLVRAGKVRAYQTKHGQTLFTEADLAERKAGPAWLRVEEPPHTVSLGRSGPRWRFPAAAKPAEVLRVYRRLLGKKMPKVKVPRGASPTEVVQILKKALNADVGPVIRRKAQRASDQKSGRDGLLGPIPDWSWLPKYKKGKKAKAVRS